MAHKRPWKTRVLDRLHAAVSWHSVTPGNGNDYLPRLGHDDAVRVVVLRTYLATDPTRIVLTEMTPEEAIDLGTRLAETGRAVGNANLQQSNGWIVNKRTLDDGWRTATASTHPALMTEQENNR